MTSFATYISSIVLATAVLSGFGTKVEAKPPDGVVCTKHHSAGHECWDNCTKNGSPISGSYQHDGLWHDGICGALAVRPTPTAGSKEDAVIMSPTGSDTATPEKKAVPSQKR